jgi:DnaJ-class molecular chaperone
MIRPRRMGTEETGPMDPIQPRMMECPECRGVGYVGNIEWYQPSIPCRACHGTGLVPAEEPEPPDTREERRGAR